MSLKQRTFGAEKKSNPQTNPESHQMVLTALSALVHLEYLISVFNEKLVHECFPFQGEALQSKEHAFPSVFVLPVRAQRTNPLPSPQQESSTNRKPTLVTALCSFSTSTASKPLKSRRLIYCPC